ncbi:hypothetical protein BROUX41_005780 [Berkeleyomyces rouxiae]|uniref:uncharacterized protein n=1 Tax=Berkeleyomyces rouxiae TaxID=2035830 RepID=UPI003B7D7F8E
MWVLESSGQTFQGRQRWLRPGRRYVFGRTSNDVNEIVVSHKTVSRKHLAISVAAVAEGAAQNLSSRSAVVLEDLGSSKGTTLDGTALKGSGEVSGERAEFKLGFNPEVFRLYWVPVVLVYSFAAKSSQVDMLTDLRSQLEQLDIKFLADYHAHATHVVTKKRNTPKGLQALINGKYIVTNAFVDTVVAAAVDEGGISALEQDYLAHWPQPKAFVPPKGNESIDRPPEAFLPDAERQDVFKGYTFVFYDEAQHKNLLAPITNGKGKAMLYAISPQNTQPDDLVRYAKNAAGESGVGEFDDGSIGPGVVVVRYVPGRGDEVAWYTDFITSVSLRLNHRAIEQSEFIEAILTKDATFLRRPLPAESSTTTQISMGPVNLSTPVLPPQHSATLVSRSASLELSSQWTMASRPRGRKPAIRRFKGFDSDDDTESLAPDSVASQWQPDSQSEAQIMQSGADLKPVNVGSQDSDEGMFMPEGPAVGVSQIEPEVLVPHRPSRPERKRPLQTLMDDSLMDDIAPTAALAKRRRIENGQDLDDTSDAVKPESDPEPEEQPPPEIRPRRVKKEIDVLEVARKAREEEEARLQREKDDLAHMPEGIDLLAIRQLHVVESMPLRHRPPPPASNDPEALVSSGRWDPRWNGRRNFKKFRARGEAVGRAPMRLSIPLMQVKTKDFGIGDDYWLEEGGSHRVNEDDGADESMRQVPGRSVARRGVASEDESDDDDLLDITDVQPASRSQRTNTATPRAQARASDRNRESTALLVSQPAVAQPQRRAAQKRTQADVGGGAGAAAPEPSAKRARATRQTITIPDSDSEEEGRFRFGRRR